MSDAQPVRVCRYGTWIQENQTKFAFITAQSWDYYHDEYSEGDPDIGPDGYAYYALYGDCLDLDQVRSRSPTCLSEAEAVSRAESLVGPINWEA